MTTPPRVTMETDHCQVSPPGAGGGPPGRWGDGGTIWGRKGRGVGREGV